jgi:hypothetical protein
MDPLLGNKIINMFPWRWLLGNQLVTENVSVDMSDQQTFSWILICYKTGNSEQNSSPLCGGGFEYLHRTRVVGGDGKGSLESETPIN